jgi:hypothetical protein
MAMFCPLIIMYPWQESRSIIWDYTQNNYLLLSITMEMDTDFILG